MRRGAPLPPSHSPRAQACPAPLLAGLYLRATRAKAYGLPSALNWCSLPRALCALAPSLAALGGRDAP